MLKGRKEGKAEGEMGGERGGGGGAANPRRRWSFLFNRRKVRGWTKDQELEMGTPRERKACNCNCDS